MITCQQLRDWSAWSWREMLGSARNKDSLDTRAKHDFINSCRMLRIRHDYDAFQHKSVRGTISQGWKDLNHSGPVFQKCLVNVAALYPTDWTPAEYSLDYFSTCLNNGIQSNNVDLGRSLRNLPSFLREYLLLDAIKAMGIQVFLPSVNDNAQNHVDLILRLENREITIWNYVNTRKSIQMLRTKLERRGTIRSGLNLFAPINSRTDTINYIDWHIPSEKYVDRLLQAAAGPSLDIDVDSTKLTDDRFMNFLLVQRP